MKFIANQHAFNDLILESKVRMLHAARALVEHGREDYVCNALLVAAGNGLDERASTELRSYIHHSLNGIHTLPGWLERRDGYFRNREELRAARLQWIDWMIDSLTKYPDGIGPEHPDYKLKSTAKRGKK